MKAQFIGSESIGDPGDLKCINMRKQNEIYVYFNINDKTRTRVSIAYILLQRRSDQVDDKETDFQFEQSEVDVSRLVQLIRPFTTLTASS